jgi:hypothetical protein
MKSNDNMVGIARLAGPILEITKIALADLENFKNEIVSLRKKYPNDMEFGQAVSSKLLNKPKGG